MKLLLVENISDRVFVKVADLYPGTVHVKQAGLTRVDDAGIWEYAKRNGYVIASKDGDFHQLSLVHGFPPKVIYLDVGNCATADVLALLRGKAAEIAAFERSPVESIFVLSK
jgi:predicted nuclease of predicted toxin-antitoxin system